MSEVLVGGDKDFLLVRHLVLRGSQRAIGRSLAVEVQRRFMQAPLDGDPLRLAAPTLVRPETGRNTPPAWKESLKF